MDSTPQVEGDHHQHHAHSHDFTEANRQHFNTSVEAAHHADRPDYLKIAKKVGKLIVDAYPFDEEKTTLMDFACGTGGLSRELAPHVKSIVGVDISQSMVDEFNRRVSNQGIPPEEMKAVCTDLQAAEGALDGQKFDVVVCLAAYHHFASPSEVSRTLVYFLKPGGALFVMDVMKNPSGEVVIPATHNHVVPHPFGFDEADMRVILEGAGLENFNYQKALSATMRGNKADLFIANASKPAVH
ncbi:S-adenosyl-L-methionine-dependent methyltransferase [Punctularia strigosozonata HHB-11173 SS5]|uniref:S-adenosyl-L-methionine-dependent methyltransferase n=1 Tax=Punctularia strigosozonata (strain HHB-11173) TaxID=741275 RepID=UPI0004416FCC|nr:S-adenosyl-L-methionine-dependent methyltransferase [Punctularia strigosozonata HHB-11173 SS5]EIN07939.1 S-adenosyl-L-methionine-dependent methyltransferase [Punctularia strigosozonata HHB-11173 SS5]